MRWLLFLSRLAFICNLVFLVAFSLRIYDWVKDETLTSTIAMLGFVLAAILNPFTVLCYLVFFMFRRKSLAAIPAWLMVVNIVFLFLQLIYVVMLNTNQLQ